MTSLNIPLLSVKQKPGVCVIEKMLRAKAAFGTLIYRRKRENGIL